jgi:hypothetical protein
VTRQTCPAPGSAPDPRRVPSGSSGTFSRASGANASSVIEPLAWFG